MVEFIDISIEGFCSIGGKLKYKLNTPGITLLRASNGIGKTTVLSAFLWVLSGKTLKNTNEVNTWEECRPESYTGTRVKLTFRKGGHEYVVYRHSNYLGKTLGEMGKDKVILIEDKEIINKRTKYETTNTVLELIGYSAELLKSTVIFGQRLKRLVESKSEEKQKILEEALEVSFISKARKAADEERLLIKSDYQKVNSFYEICNEKYKGAKTLYRHVKKEQGDSDNERLDNLSRERKRSEDLAKSVEALLRRKREIEALQEAYKSELAKYASYTKFDKPGLTYKQLVDIYDRISFSAALASNNSLAILERINKRIKLKEEQLVKLKPICDNCGSTIDYKAYKKILKKKLSVLAEKLVKAKESLANVSRISGEKESSAKQVKSLVCSFEENEVKIKKIDEETKAIIEKIGESAKRIEELRVPTKRNLKILKKAKEKLRKYKQELKPLKKEVKETKYKLDMYEWMVKDPLSNSGIKAYVLNTCMSLINDKLRYYGSQIDIEVVMGLNLSSKRREFYIDVNLRGATKQYDELSGGEKQLVDIIMAFALHDVVSMDKDLNILLMDEAFEGLDKANIEVVTKFISDKAKNKSVHVITHLSEYEPRASNIVLLERNNLNNTILA